MSKFWSGVAGLGGALTAFYTTPLDYYKKSSVDTSARVPIDTKDVGSFRLNNDSALSNSAIKLFFLMPFLIVKGFFWDSWRKARAFYKGSVKSERTDGWQKDFGQSMHLWFNALIPTRKTKDSDQYVKYEESFNKVPLAPHTFPAFVGSFIAWSGLFLAVFTKLFDYMGANEVKTGAAANVFSAPLELGRIFINGIGSIFGNDSTINSIAYIPSSQSAAAFFTDIGMTLGVVMLTAVLISSFVAIVHSAWSKGNEHKENLKVGRPNGGDNDSLTEKQPHTKKPGCLAGVYSAYAYVTSCLPSFSCFGGSDEKKNDHRNSF